MKLREDQQSIPPVYEEGRALRRIFLVLAIMLVASVLAIIRSCAAAAL